MPRVSCSIIQPQCSRCQACVEACPELFAWDEELGEVVVREDCADAPDLAKAVAWCPHDCIEVHDPDTP
ncbi:ferredoxin [Desulfocurvus sp.]|jgi:ferredoxin|uniref:ferredoxin n=1 Tax=Desulfocurvus sp. TaxID=2871698 RepID=UPI0025BB2EBC|nr:ferredoxin [Desulfocurvus sp.]MCK9240780.1 ferredoxin [Desulfocurvus sp.]